MVEIEPVRAERAPSGLGEDDLMADMLHHDAFRLRRLVERHLHLTNSKRARELLQNWDDVLPKFVKVMPLDYRRALTSAAAAAETKKPVAAKPRSAEKSRARTKLRA
jgi:glutamate synthase domain-containing protein 3